MASITIFVKVAWWLRLYLDGVILMSNVTGLEPDWTKLDRMIDRGISVELR